MDGRSGLHDLEKINGIQSSHGNWDYDEYMRGMANGLILAVAIMKNKEAEYLDKPKEYIQAAQ